MLIPLSISIISAASILFFSRRLLRYLYHFQAGGYSRNRFKNWLVENSIYDKKGTLIATIAAISIELIGEHELIALAICIVGAGALISLGFWEQDPRKVGRKRLLMTDRATFIYNISITLYSIVFAILVCCIYAFNHDDLAPYWLAVIMAIQSSPLWLTIARTIELRR